MFKAKTRDLVVIVYRDRNTQRNHSNSILGSHNNCGLLQSTRFFNQLNVSVIYRKKQRKLSISTSERIKTKISNDSSKSLPSSAMLLYPMTNLWNCKMLSLQWKLITPKSECVHFLIVPTVPYN